MLTLHKAEDGIQILSGIANDCGLSINQNNSRNQSEYI